jgi:predicted nucleic acid-binding protein
MIVVDSSVWISFFAGADNSEVEKLKAIEDRTQILVVDVVIVEVLRGARSESAARQIERDMRRFEMVDMLGPAMSLRAAANYRRLRDVGITIRSTIDLIIGTYCIEHGHHLLHRDRDFHHMRRIGLLTYDP